VIDIGILREDRERLKTALARRGLDIDVDVLVELDARRRRLRAQSEEFRAEQKRIGKQVPTLAGKARQEAIERAAQLGEESKRIASEAGRADAEFERIWATVPNLPHETAAEGLTEDDAVEVRRWGEPRGFDFPALDHVELGERLGMIDIERAVKVSGSRFAYLLGPAVAIELALVRWALDRLTAEGFTPVVPPVLVRERALFGTGFLPGERDQVYEIPRDELFLVGTSEVALASLHMDEILDTGDLPLRYTGFSTCFRREAGTYGKDARGIFRVHQFDKVEMFAFVHPETSWEEHERLLATEESLVQALELPYRVVNVAAGDLGAAAAKKYDIEAWIPSQGAYREITSCSNTTDYQSRRLKIRFRAEGENRLVHTLNGTAVAVGRTLLAIMENYQQADGSIEVPEILRPYVGFEQIKPEARDRHP
jgi:seryl-tRNA synthetase